MSLEQLQDNWAIIMGFVAGVLTWGKTASAVKSQGDAQIKMDARVTSIEKDITVIKESAASIAASAQATRETVDLLLKSQLG